MVAAPRLPLWQRAALAIGCLCLGLSVIPRWLCGRDADAVFDGDAELQHRLARHLARAVTARPERHFYASGSARFDGQSAIAVYQMTVLALGQVVLAHPERRAEYLPAMQAAGDRLVDPATLQYAAQVYGQHGAVHMDPGEGHAYLGYINLALGMLRVVDPGTRHAALHDRITAQLAERLERAPHGLIETYPGETWPPDVAAVAGSIGLHASATGQDRRAMLDTWATRFARCAVDGSGYLVQRVRSGGCHPVDAPRGSGSAVASYFIAFAHPELSRRLFDAIARDGTIDLLGFAGVREYAQGHGFDIPARQAFVVDMVGPEDLMNAIALNSSMMNGARLVGPAIAGLLVTTVGEGWCFAVNAVSFLAVIAGLLAMRRSGTKPAPRRASALADVVEGFRFVWRHTPIRALVLLLGVVSLAGMPYVVLMPIFADRILHGGAQALGVLMAASGGGALVGALALAARKEVRGLGLWVAVATTSFGVALAAFAFSRSFWLSTALLVPLGAAIMISFAGVNTLIQSLAPDAMRGRVMAVFTMMFMGMAPFGALLAGSVADRIGPPLTLAGGAAVCVVAGLVFAWKLPGIRNAAHAIRAATQTVPPPDQPA